MMNTLNNAIAITDNHPWYASDHIKLTIIALIGSAIFIILARATKRDNRFFNFIALLFLFTLLGTCVARMNYEYMNPHPGTSALQIHEKFGLTQVSRSFANEEEIIYRDRDGNLYSECDSKIVKTEETADQSTKYVKLYCSYTSMSKKIEMKPTSK